MQVNRRAFTQLLAVLGVATASKAMAQGKTVDVAMPSDGQSMFDPASAQIGLGDTVRWTNKGVLVHTVTFAPAQATKAADVVLPAGVAPFGSNDLNQDDTFSHTFTAKGTYKYVCKYHEDMGMVGTVIVS
jgi:plastocyanin